MSKVVVSILDFGAAPDTGALQTESIQRAIDHCFAQGGGEVIVPAGKYLTGGIRIRSNVTLHLLENAYLKGSRNPDDYDYVLSDPIEPIEWEADADIEWSREQFNEDGTRSYTWMRVPVSRWNHGLIRAINAENIAIIGEKGSVLDGSDCFDERGEEHYRGPHLINMHRVKNAHFAGYTCVDSANWAHAILYSEDLLFENITVIAGHDGIHCRGCERVVIRHCRFETGDDCVAGFGNIDVHVHDCEINTACSAFRYGGTNVLIERCHCWGPANYVFRGSLTPEEKRSGVKPQRKPGHRYNMLSLYTYYADHSIPIRKQPGNLVIRDCTVENADRFLHFNYSGNERWQQNRPLADVTFQNIRAAGVSMPLTAYGSVDLPVTLTMENVDVTLREGSGDIAFIQTANYAQINLKNVAIHGADGGCLVRTWGGDGALTIENLDADYGDLTLVPATTPFTCKPI